MPYSQNDEESVILSYFKGETGRLLDIGAFDGQWCSNTYEMIKQGWSGVCIEPSPIPFTKLLALHEKNAGVQCVQAIVGEKPGLTRFLDNFGDALSTTNPDWPNAWKGHTFRPMWAVTVTIRDILNQFGSEFRFLNIDTEGTNLSVLKSIPLAEMKTELVCVEYEYSNPTPFLQYFDSIGWHAFYRSPQNLIARPK